MNSEDTNEISPSFGEIEKLANLLRPLLNRCDVEKILAELNIEVIDWKALEVYPVLTLIASVMINHEFNKLETLLPPKAKEAFQEWKLKLGKV